MKSIQRRLGWGLIISLILVGVCLLQSSLWLFESSLRNNLQAHLEEEAEGLMAATLHDAQGWQLDGSRINPRYRRAYSGYYFRIQVAGQLWRSRSLWDSSPSWPEEVGLSTELIQGPQHQHLLTYRARYHRGHQEVLIDVAQDYSPILHSFQQIRLSGFLLTGLALLVLLLMQRYAIKRALQPLERARQQIVQLQQGQRQQLDVEAPEELQPLVAQINHLLNHTELTLKRSRNALGNLGHALKTPLAVLNTLIDRAELAQSPKLKHSLQEQIDQIQQRISLELNRARLATDVLPGRYFDCQHELPALLNTLRTIHGPNVRLEWHAPTPCQLPKDREDMLELLGNLLDNACKWATHRVCLEIHNRPHEYQMLIDDDGPGIPPEQREEALARGRRLDEQPTGHGLGLDIVGDIVSAWQGQWHLETSPLGGLRVRIQWPKPA